MLIRQTKIDDFADDDACPLEGPSLSFSLVYPIYYSDYVAHERDQVHPALSGLVPVLVSAVRHRVACRCTELSLSLLGRRAAIRYFVVSALHTSVGQLGGRQSAGLLSGAGMGCVFGMVDVYRRHFRAARTGNLAAAPK